MPPTDPHRLWYLLGAVAGYFLLMFTNPVRGSLRDGFRCIRRHGSIWAILLLFGFCYAAFNLGVEIFFNRVLPEGHRPEFLWSRAWYLSRDMQLKVLADSWLPALESVAGYFNNIITTFPCSALAAFLLLVNWEGHHAVLNRALRRRFGAAGWLIYLGILLCAVAAMAEPFLYGPTLPALNDAFPNSGLQLLQISLLIDWFSFLFEYLFGVCIQIYLILLAYVWVRGLSYTPRHLLDVAIRRSSFVLKWAAVVMFLSSALFNVPSILSTVPAFAPYALPLTLDARMHFARVMMAAFLMFFCTVQITLTFHSESLLRALRDHLRFLSVNWWPFSWFILIAGLHFFLLKIVDLSLLRGFGERTGVILIWRLANPMLAALMAGWLLSAWVCLFKRCETGRVHDDWIRF